MNIRRFHISLLIGLILALIWSAIRPHDYFTWFLEVIPAIFGAVLLVSTYKKFQFTTLIYTLIFFHAIVLIIGGHYTYAEVPLFNWLRDSFHLQRNYYDRVGHFMQGFVPAMIARELFVRQTPLKRGGWLFFVCVCVCMTISSIYELFEWAVAVSTGTAADAFLGTQGDVWDTQWDMFMAFVGALVALSSLSSFHDTSLRKIGIDRE